MPGAIASGRRATPRFTSSNDVLQYLGFLAFRAPIPAYKHSAAMFLKLRGWIDCDATHPQSPTRPDTDRELLREIAATAEPIRFPLTRTVGVTAHDRPERPTPPRPDKALGWSVLVVDDEPMIRRVAELSLNSAGCRVAEAADAAAAVAAVRGADPPFDLVILDVTLPDGDGTAVVPFIRQTRSIRAS